MRQEGMNDQLGNIKIAVLHFALSQTDLSCPPVHPHLISHRLWATSMCWSFSVCFNFISLSDTAVDIACELIYDMDANDWSLYFLAFFYLTFCCTLDAVWRSAEGTVQVWGRFPALEIRLSERNWRVQGKDFYPEPTV